MLHGQAWSGSTPVATSTSSRLSSTRSLALRPHSRPQRPRPSSILAEAAVASTSEAVLPAPTPEPAAPGFLAPNNEPFEDWVRPQQRTYATPSIRESGSLRPGPEWYPAWMKYRRREDNYIFWQEKFVRCSLEIPDIEKRWTLFSTLWYLIGESRFMGIPPSLRFISMIAWRSIMQRVYEAHKTIVLWQCKVDAYLASQATNGSVCTFSPTMALRRLHWRNSLVAELAYAVNVAKTGRVHMLPPVKKPFQRPTFFFLF